MQIAPYNIGIHDRPMRLSPASGDPVLIRTLARMMSTSAIAKPMPIEPKKKPFYTLFICSSFRARLDLSSSSSFRR
jgi:hypothetical protein